jgi:hypothetical protein
VPNVPIQANEPDAPLPGGWISRNTTLTVVGYVTVVLLAVVGAVIHAVNGDDPEASAVAATDDQTTSATEPAPEPDPEPEATKEPKPDLGPIALGEEDSIGAGVMCEQPVEERLTSPSTAEFDWDSNRVTLLGADHYLVEGTVDSENTFGAMVRSNFACNIKDNGDDTWTLKSLQVTR